MVRRTDSYLSLTLVSRGPIVPKMGQAQNCLALIQRTRKSTTNDVCVAAGALVSMMSRLRWVRTQGEIARPFALDALVIFCLYFVNVWLCLVDAVRMGLCCGLLLWEHSIVPTAQPHPYR